MLQSLHGKSFTVHIYIELSINGELNEVLDGERVF
jgi:hypothetical protein